MPGRRRWTLAGVSSPSRATPGVLRCLARMVGTSNRCSRSRLQVRVHRRGGLHRYCRERRIPCSWLISPSWVEVFSPSLEFVRRFRLAGPGTVRAAIHKNNLLVSASIMTPDLVGLPLHWIDGDGTRIRSFGGDGKTFIRGRTPPISAPYAFAMTHGGESVWVGNDTALSFKRWTMDGRLSEEIAVTSVPWIVPLVYYDTVGGRGGRTALRRRRPHAQLTLARVDRNGRLWVSSYVPPSNAPVKSHPGKYAVHVIDPASRSFVVSQPVEEEFRHLTGDLSYTRSSDGAGGVVFTVWRSSMKGM